MIYISKIVKTLFLLPLFFPKIIFSTKNKTEKHYLKKETIRKFLEVSKSNLCTKEFVKKLNKQYKKNKSPIKFVISE